MVSQQLIALLFATVSVSALPSGSQINNTSHVVAIGNSHASDQSNLVAVNGGQIERNSETVAIDRSQAHTTSNGFADNGFIRENTKTVAIDHSKANTRTNNFASNGGTIDSNISAVAVDRSSASSDQSAVAIGHPVNPPAFDCNGDDCDDVIGIKPYPQIPRNCGGKPCEPIYPPVKECKEPHCQPKQCVGIDCYKGIQFGGHYREVGFRQFFQKSFVSVLKNLYSGIYQKCIVDYSALLYQLQYRHFKLSSDCHSCWGPISASKVVIPKCELTKFNANALSLSFKPEDCQDKVITFGHKSLKLVNVIFTEQIFTATITKATFELTLIGIIEGKQVSIVIPVQVGDKDCGFFAQFGPHLSGDISSGIDLFNVDFSALFVGLQYTIQQVDGFHVAICQTPVVISYQYFAFFAQYLAISVSGSGSGSVPVLGNGKNAYQTDIAY